MLANETENQTRLRRATKSLEDCRAAENEASKALALAVESTKRTRERWEQLFLVEEKQESARLREAYNHATK